MVAPYARTEFPAERAGTAIFIPVTNAVESLNRSLRKMIKTRGSFPTDEAALKLLFLAIRNADVHWRRPIEWTAAVGQFAILFGDRFEPSAR
jgi:putative transposase